MIFILLPAYNEEEGLEKLLTRISRIMNAYGKPYRLIIVNDGSVDHTVEVIQSFNELPITLVNFEKNKGIRDVFRTGFRMVCEQASDDEVCVTLDSDNTQNPYTILDVLRKLDEGYDVVIASRFEPGGKMVGAPMLRRFLSVGVAWLLRTIFALPNVKDYSTFFRGYRVGIVRKGVARFEDDLIAGHGFSAMANMLIKLGEVTDKFAEVPLVLRYDLKEGGSGMRIFRTIWGYVRIIETNWGLRRNRRNI